MVSADHLRYSTATQRKADKPAAGTGCGPKIRHQATSGRLELSFQLRFSSKVAGSARWSSKILWRRFFKKPFIIHSSAEASNAIIRELKRPSTWTLPRRRSRLNRCDRLDSDVYWTKTAVLFRAAQITRTFALIFRSRYLNDYASSSKTKNSWQISALIQCTAEETRRTPTSD